MKHKLVNDILINITHLHIKASNLYIFCVDLSDITENNPRIVAWNWYCQTKLVLQPNILYF